MPTSSKPAAVVAKRIGELRAAHKPPMPQGELARRLRELGFKLDQTALSKLERGHKPISVDLACALALALDAPLLALLSPIGDNVVRLTPDLEVTADEFELWSQGMGHLSGTDVDSYLEAGRELKIPRRALERARTEALAEKRERLARELKKLDEQIEGEA